MYGLCGEHCSEDLSSSFMGRVLAWICQYGPLLAVNLSVMRLSMWQTSHEKY